MKQDATPTTASRYESLDAWRGVACLIVVVYHAISFAAGSQSTEALQSVGGLLLFLGSKGFHGVTLFFVISGYCISAAVDASARRQTPIADFFRRRIRRIFPPFWVFFGMTALATALIHALGGGRFLWEVSVGGVGTMKPPSDLSGSQWLANLTLTETWLPGLFGRVPRFLEGTGHAWSLAYEEQFYVVCGLLLIAARRQMKRFFAGALVASLVTFVVATSPNLRSRVGGLFLDGNWIYFACGIAVYYDRMYATVRQQWAVRGLLMALFVVGLRSPSTSADLLFSTGFALALIGLQRWDAVWAQARPLRFFWWCGTRCYSLYLVHWTITRPLTRVLFEAGVRSVWGTIAITLPFCVGISVLAAWAFHAAIERRFLNRPRRVRTETVDAVPLAVGSAAIASRPVAATLNAR